MDIKIITIHHIHNFGSVFQGYALYKFLKDNNYNAEIIDYQPDYFVNGKQKIKSIVGKVFNLPAYLKRQNKFNNFIKTYDSLTKRKYSKISELEQEFMGSTDVFIAGGDQLWNDYHPCGKDMAYKLNFTKSARKIAYGTSMGRDNYKPEELEILAKQTDNFSKIMLRENSTVKLLEKYSKTTVEHVIDPVGLISNDVFKKIAIKPKISEPYAVMYLADSSPLLDKAVEYLSKVMNLKIVHICGFRKKCYCDYFVKDAGPEEILGYILNADFVLSASFHATMFSLLFNKQFATVLPGENTNARIEDVLSNVNLKERIINSEDKINVLGQKIDFNYANSYLNDFREKSAKMLIDSLGE